MATESVHEGSSPEPEGDHGGCQDSARASFPAASGSVRAARGFVVSHVRLDGRAGQDAALVTSELAANAVLHASTPFEVSVWERAGMLRIEVADGSTDLPVGRRAGATATSGRGLGIVARVAESWGAERTRTGKTVWAELRIASSDQHLRRSDTSGTAAAP